MQLIQRALTIYEQRVATATAQEEAHMKQRVRDTKDLFARVFGFPYEEVFDITVTDVTEEGGLVNAPFHIESNEDGLRVVAYGPEDGPRLGEYTFGRTGAVYWEDNLYTLGCLLASTYLKVAA